VSSGPSGARSSYRRRFQPIDLRSSASPCSLDPLQADAPNDEYSSFPEVHGRVAYSHVPPGIEARPPDIDAEAEAPASEVGRTRLLRANHAEVWGPFVCASARLPESMAADVPTGPLPWRRKLGVVQDKQPLM
jgi:hypothetical protein